MDERYRLLNKLINDALKTWHPDHYRGDDDEAATSMTRGLIAARQTVRRVYLSLQEPHRLIVSDFGNDDD